MTILQFFDVFFGPREWRKERRRFWLRAVKWILAFACWLPLVFLWWIS